MTARQITAGPAGGMARQITARLAREVGQVSEAHGQQGKRCKLTGQVNPRRGQPIERSRKGSGWAQMRRWQGAGAGRELMNSRGRWRNSADRKVGDSGAGRREELTAEGELDGTAGGEVRVSWLFDVLLPTEINSVGG